VRVAGSEAVGTTDIGTAAPGTAAASRTDQMATRLVIAGLAGFSYAWGVSNFPLEPFYAAAVRSMGANWSDFFFGAVDPRGRVSLDKLPGAFWVQALFVRVLGFHYWVVALPQVIAGALTILVLYRLVRRLVGPKAGLVAALIMAASPVTALLNRGNVSDPIFVLLVVLAADATVHALSTVRSRPLLLAGL
jgi:4-amino-4-deoxy-L-arabinose transferase-like glycosyltransferase